MKITIFILQEVLHLYKLCLVTYIQVTEDNVHN